MRRRAVWLGLTVAAVAASVSVSTGAAAAGSSHARIVLAPNHHVSARPGGGGGHGGGGGTPWPGWSSSNWSGYAVTSAAPYTAATGTWTVPTVARTRGSSYSAAWVGVGGFNDAALIQTGTEQDFVNGQAQYAAWWTTDAQGYAEQPFDLTVHPGDHITATLEQLSRNSWSIQLTDATTSTTASTTVTNYTNPGLSAEWIMEAPGVGGRTASLAHYGSDVFDPGTVNGGASPAFTAADGGVLVQKSTIVSIPSAPDSDHDGFTAAYGATQPAPPTT